MKDSKLQEEQVELKKKLAELVDFTTSEGYFTLPENKRGLINQQRVGMELYLSSLTKRLYEEDSAADSSSLLWLTLLTGMFNSPSGFGSYKGTSPSKGEEMQYVVPENTTL